jgi:surfactin synthase thioesterase subunit
MKKPQLFLLHFAGGNYYSFQSIVPLLRDFEVIPLELPGRGKRISEPLLKDYALAAQDFYDQIINKLTTASFLIYGHSMGAYLGLTVANMLEKIGRPPAYLFVSGNPGPGITDSKNRYLLEYDEFVNELREMGGVPEEIIENKDLFDFFEPILRADFEIVEKYPLSTTHVTSAPLYAMMGSRENKVEEITNWGRFTRGSFNHEVLEGDHFFIFKHPNKIAHIIRYNYEQAIVSYRQHIK